MPDTAPRLQLFQSRWLERLTVISAPAFIGLWALLLPAILATAWGTADLATGVALMAGGALVWTLTEYAMHRFLFHWQPARQAAARFVFVLHGNHHAVPNDPLRNLMPPSVSLPLGGLIWLGFLALLGPAGGLTFFGFITGYVVYDLVHYACHQYPMKGRLARMLKTHHMRHHHSREEGNFAITGMMWDRLFGTRIRHPRRQPA
jgi:sterol desaturase/sphingolipid hydroxylase (fatty acid hydroxylase superfamily)